MEMRVVLELVAVIIAAFASSSGMWMYIQKKTVNKDATVKLLMGLAYDRIQHLGMKYLERGYITKDEYEDFHKYFYQPYREFGGNGVAERIMKELDNLPLKQHSRYADIIEAKKQGQENLNEV